jgi:hypothetical protein
LRVSASSIIGGIGVFLGVIISTMDSYKAAMFNDLDAAFFHATAAVISIAGFLYFGAALVTTPLGWAIIAIGLIVSILAMIATDNSLEKWAINGPFSKDVDDRCTGDFKKWLDYPKDCYAALANELMAPQATATIQKLVKPSNLLVIDIDLPGFAVGQSELILYIMQKEDAGILSKEYSFRVSQDNWKITQKMDTNKTQITGFTYNVPFLSMWPKNIDVEWEIRMQYRLEKNVTLPYVDKAEREKWDKDDVPDKAWLIKEIEYA